MARQHRTNGIGRLRSASALTPECAAAPAGGARTTATARRRILRPYATAGVAIVGSGLIAVTPAVAPLPDLQVVRDVALAAGMADLFAPWQEVYNTAAQNATTLLQNYYLAPGIGFQQFLANQGDYWQQALDDPSNLNAVMEQMQAHLNAVTTGYSMQDVTDDDSAIVTVHTLDGSSLSGHAFLFDQIAGFLPPDVDQDMVMPIINFLASPLSGIIMGMIGPGISPWVALMNSITDGDGLNETFANMVGAFYNGATLDLTALTPMINHAGFFPPGLSLSHLEFAFGGLFSPGSVSVGPYEVLGEGGDVVASVPAVGGSIFNSLGVVMDGVPLLNHIDLPGVAIGPIGAWQAWGQTVGALLGSGWDGKGAVVVTPPAAGFELPTIPTDFLDDGGVGDAVAGTDGMTDWFGDLLGLFS
ncbi:MAG: outer membrane porin GjpA [Actinomycetota bacterium]|nr:outer membrane porin GjpA [Actinomycetota bacterium]